MYKNSIENSILFFSKRRKVMAKEFVKNIGRWSLFVIIIPFAMIGAFLAMIIMDIRYFFRGY